MIVPSLSWKELARVHGPIVLVLMLIMSGLFISLDNQVFELRDDGTIISEEATEIILDQDNNIIIAGYTLSDTIDITLGGDRRGKEDVFVFKFDSNYNLLWSRLLGGTDRDLVSGLAVDTENNIIVSGSTHSKDFEQEDYNLTGSYDLFVTKLDPSGQLVWTQFFGSVGSYFSEVTNVETFDSILVAPNNTILLGGSSFSSNIIVGDREASFDRSHPFDLFLLHLNSSGDVIWVRYQPATWGDIFSSMIYIDDTIVTSTCVDHEFYSDYVDDQTLDYIYDLQKALEVKDIMLTQYTLDGQKLDQMIYGGSGYDCTTDMRVVANGILLSGLTRSDDFTEGGSTNYHGGYGDIFVTELDNDFNIVTTTLMGGEAIDGANRHIGGSFATVSDDTIVLVATTHSTNLSSTSEYSGIWDIIVVVMKDNQTNINYYGGTGSDIVEGMIIVGDQIVIIGYTQSDDFDELGNQFSNHEGYRDSFIMGFDMNGLVEVANFL